MSTTPFLELLLDLKFAGLQPQPDRPSSSQDSQPGSEALPLSEILCRASSLEDFPALEPLSFSFSELMDTSLFHSEHNGIDQKSARPGGCPSFFLFLRAKPPPSPF